MTEGVAAAVASSRSRMPAHLYKPLQTRPADHRVGEPMTIDPSTGMTAAQLADYYHSHRDDTDEW